MSEYYGPKVTRTVGNGDDSYDIVVFQAGKPPLDSELNLVGNLNSEASAKVLRATTPSGWLFDPLNAQDDYFTDSSYHNVFVLGRQNETVANGLVSVDPNADGGLYAIVNGWVINVTGVGTGLYAPLTTPTVSLKASLTIQNITYTAVTPGVGGNLINFTYLVPASGNTPLTVVVTGNAIVVNLSTNASQQPNTTASQVLAAVLTNAQAAALVTGIASGCPTDIQAPTNPPGIPIYMIGGASIGPSYYPASILNSDARNLIQLPFGSGISYNTNFVFLEVFKALVQPNPSTLNKPTATTVYAYGNTQFGGTDLPDDLIDPAMGFVTTLRAQLQYRIRVVQNVDLINHPDGLGDPGVYAIGAYSGNNPQQLNYQYTNMGQFLDDPGLWRAGDGNPANGLGTVDGYTYAVPICAVSRRNTSPFSMLDGGSANLNGAGVVRIPPTQPFGLPDGSIIPPSVLSSILPSDRPDGKYNDLIAIDDIIDLRHCVRPGGFDHASLLQGALNQLLNGKLRTTPKLIPINGTRYGTKLLYLDEIASATNPAGNIIAIGDGVRKIFSDASVQQVVTITPQGIPPSAKNPFPESPSGTSAPWNPQDSYTLDLSAFTNLSVSLPHDNQASIQNVQVVYDGNYPVASGNVSAASSNSVTLTASIPAGLNPINPSYNGYAVKVTGGTGAGQVVAVGPTTSLPNTTLYIVPNWTIIPDPTSSIEVVPFIATTTTTTDPDGNVIVTLSSLNGISVYSGVAASNPLISAHLSNNLVITFNIIYPENNGLSARPDTVYLVNYVNPNVDATVLTTQSTVVQGTASYTPLAFHAASLNSQLMAPHLQRTIIEGEVSTATAITLGLATSSQNHISGFYSGALLEITSGVGAGQTRRINGYNSVTNVVNVDQSWTIIPLITDSYQITLDQPSLNYFGNEFINGECFYDLGSKSVIVQPWRAIQNYNLYQQNFLNPFIGTNFFNSQFSDTQFVEVPMAFLPPLGRQDIPIQSTGTFVNQASPSIFQTGINGIIFNTINPPSNSQVIIPVGITATIFQVNKTLAYETTISVSGQTFVGCQINSLVNGIELPRYIGIARISGVFYATTTIINGNTYFAYGTASPTNLLRFTSITGVSPSQQVLPTRTLWIGKTGANQSVTFTLLGDVISTFDPTLNTGGGYVIVADYFGYSDGFMESNGRLMAPAFAAFSINPVPVNILTNAFGPRSSSIIQVVYDRNVYQGEIYTPQEEVDVPFGSKGPVALALQVALEQPLVNPVRSNEYFFTALEQTDFATTLGTGRFSGKLSNQAFIQDDSQKYPDINAEVSGLTTRLPLGSKYTDADFTGEAFELGEFATNNVPFLGTSQPLTEITGQSGELDFSEEAIVSGNKFSISDGSHNFTLKTQFRTKRGGAALQYGGYQPGGAFAGEHGVGNVTNRALYGVAALVKNNLELTPNTSSGIQTVGTGDGTTVTFNNVLLGTPITPTTVIIYNAGTQIASDNGFGLITGATLSSGTVNYNTGVLTLTFRAAPLASNAITATYTGHANMASAGGEMQLVVGTGVVEGNNSIFKMVNSPSGAGEGFSAVDRYRIPGRPLEKTTRHIAPHPLLSAVGPYPQDPTLDKTWITGINPLVTDVNGLIQVYGTNLEEKQIFIRSASIPPTSMSAYSRRFIGGMEFSLPSYSTFWRPFSPVTGQVVEQTYDLILVGQSGEVIERDGAFQYHFGGLGVQKHLAVIGNFETYPTNSYPADSSSIIGSAWECFGYVGNSLTPTPVLLKQGFLVSGNAAGTGFRQSVRFHGQGPETLTHTATVAKQVATFNFQELQSALLLVNETNTFVLGFQISFAGGLVPGEQMTAGFQFSDNTVQPLPYPPGYFLAISQGSSDTTYKVLVGADIVSAQVVDTLVPLDNNFHAIEFVFSTTSLTTSYKITFDGLTITNPLPTPSSVNAKIISGFSITDDASTSTSTGAQASLYVADIYLKVQ